MFWRQLLSFTRMVSSGAPDTIETGVIARVGVILYMFVVGLELDLKALHERAHTLPERLDRITTDDLVPA